MVAFPGDVNDLEEDFGFDPPGVDSHTGDAHFGTIRIRRAASGIAWYDAFVGVIPSNGG